MTSSVEFQAFQEISSSHPFEYSLAEQVGRSISIEFFLLGNEEDRESLPSSNISVNFEGVNLLLQGGSDGVVDFHDSAAGEMHELDGEVFGHDALCNAIEQKEEEGSVEAEYVVKRLEKIRMIAEAFYRFELRRQLGY